MTGMTTHGLTVEELFASDVRCAYPSKVCTNYRAVKLNGTLHKLCEFHRSKANLNQKRLQQRRRAIRQQMEAKATFSLNFISHTDLMLPSDIAKMASVRSGFVSVDYNALEGNLMCEPRSRNVDSSSADTQGFAVLESAKVDIRL